MLALGEAAAGAVMEAGAEAVPRMIEYAVDEALGYAERNPEKTLRGAYATVRAVRDGKKIYDDWMYEDPADAPGRRLPHPRDAPMLNPIHHTEEDIRARVRERLERPVRDTLGRRTKRQRMTRTGKASDRSVQKRKGKKSKGGKTVCLSKCHDSTHTWRYVENISSVANQNTGKVFNIALSGTQLENAFETIRTYNGQATPSVDVHDLADASVHRTVTIDNVHDSLTFYNLNQVGVEVEVYLLQCRNTTNQGVSQTLSNALEDQFVSRNDLVTETNQTTGDFQNSALWYPNEISGFKKFWKSKKVLDTIIKPGERRTVTHNTGMFDYQPHVRDNGPTTFSPAWKSHGFLIRFHGVPVRNTNVASSGAALVRPIVALDMELKRTVKVAYDAGIDLRDFSFSTPHSRADAVTVGGAIGKNGEPVASPFGPETPLPARV
jgi:hypothetical protein